LGKGEEKGGILIFKTGVLSPHYQNGMLPIGMLIGSPLMGPIIGLGMVAGSPIIGGIIGLAMGNVMGVEMG
jgi:hypothetical protein